MGNMIFNKRVEDWLRGENQDVEYRVFPQQMYTVRFTIKPIK